jgi:hypothetical protein
VTVYTCPTEGLLSLSGRGSSEAPSQDGLGRPSYTAEKIFQNLAAGYLPVPTGKCILVHIAAELRTGQGGYVLFQFGCDGVKSSLEGTVGVPASAGIGRPPKGGTPTVDKSCAHAAKDLSNKEETTRKGGRGPVSRKRLLYRFASRKAFPDLGLCAERPTTRRLKSCIRLRARGGYQRRPLESRLQPESEDRLKAGLQLLA